MRRSVALCGDSGPANEFPVALETVIEGSVALERRRRGLERFDIVCEDEDDDESRR